MGYRQETVRLEINHEHGRLLIVQGYFWDAPNKHLDLPHPSRKDIAQEVLQITKGHKIVTEYICYPHSTSTLQWAVHITTNKKLTDHQADKLVKVIPDLIYELQTK